MCIRDSVAAVEDPVVAGFDHPGELGVAEAVDGGHRGDLERSGHLGLPELGDFDVGIKSGQTLLRHHRRGAIEVVTGSRVRPEDPSPRLQRAPDRPRIGVIGVEVGHQGHVHRSGWWRKLPGDLLDEGSEGTPLFEQVDDQAVVVECQLNAGPPKPPDFDFFFHARTYSIRSFANDRSIAIIAGMSPRASASAAAETRSGIVEAAVNQASVEGLESVTIGRLAGRLEMSKAGVIGPFGSKENLQLATLDAAIGRFRRDVWEPVEDLEPGLTRLEAVCEAWLKHLTGKTFPGGCFLTQTAAEFDGREGPVRDKIADYSRLWEKVLAKEVRTAVADGELPGDTDPGQVAFELNALAQGTNQAIQLRGESDARKRGRRAMNRAIGID